MTSQEMIEDAAHRRTDYIVREYLAGKSVGQIATELGRSRQRVYRILKRHGVRGR